MKFSYTIFCILLYEQYYLHCTFSYFLTVSFLRSAAMADTEESPMVIDADAVIDPVSEQTEKVSPSVDDQATGMDSKVV